MVKKHTRTRVLKVKQPLLAEALNAILLQSNNLYNCAMFVCRNILSAYGKEGLKLDLYENQISLLNLANEKIGLINKNRTLKKTPIAATVEDGAVLDVAESTEVCTTDSSTSLAEIVPDVNDPKPKLIPLFEQDSNPFQILNMTLLDNMLRDYTDDKARQPYKELPAVYAQQVIRQLLVDFSNYTKSLQSYQKNPGTFTGKPKLPGYKHKGSRTTLHIPYATLGQHFISIDKKSLCLDYAKAKPLSAEARDAYASLEVSAMVEKLKDSLPEGALPQEFRIVPKAGGRVKIEGVFEISVNPNPDSLFERFYATLPDKTKVSKVNELALNWLNSLPEMPRMASADLGMNNLLSIIYSTGAKGVVLSNKFFEQELARRDAKIDALKSKLVPEDVKELQRRKDDPANKEELTPTERRRIGQGMAEVYQDVTLRKLMEERANFTESALHKISSKVVKELVARRIEGMVIGHNVGWKTESNMGRENNRRFHRSAHTRLIELIRYKAEEHGILIVETEESYTSKTSFVDNETLQSKTQPVCESHKVVLKGKRRQHTFKSASLLTRWQKYHADINGAFNILRKVFSQFVWHLGLTPKYRLWTFSHERGAYALQ